MKKPKYAGKYNFDAIYRGDSLLEKTITISANNEPLIPTKVCMQLRTKDDEFLYEFETEIDELTGKVTILMVDGEDTKLWPVGTHDYDVEYTLKEGAIRTYLYGNLAVNADVSKSLPEEENDENDEGNP
jgi:hypothetical protein